MADFLDTDLEADDALPPEERDEQTGELIVTPQMALELGNVALHLNDETLNRIKDQVCEDFEVDSQSRDKWEKQYEKAMDYALQRAKKKSTPWPNASNVVYPLITKSSLQFAARAGKALVPNRNVCRPIDGIRDPEAKKSAERVAMGVSAAIMYQQNWRQDTDRILHHAPIAGCAFRKVWWDNGVQSKWLTGKQVVVNMAFDGASTPPRVSEVLDYTTAEIQQKIRAGEWREISLDYLSAKDESDGASNEIFEFVEQHTLLDLDDDGYFEPYIVTFDKDCGEIVRIIPRFTEQDIVADADGNITSIRGANHYVKYPFFPDPENGYYDIGFGHLLGPINAAINTAINQLVDAGTLNNNPGGFLGRGWRSTGKTLEYTPGRFKLLDMPGDDIARNIYHMQFKEPSGVTFNMLSLMISAGEDISSVKDIMTGGTDLNLAPTTVGHMVEQGTKQFNAIFDRMKEALRQECALVAHFMGRNILEDDWKKIVGPEGTLNDLNPQTMMYVMPEADPVFATDAMMAQKAQFYGNLMQLPTINPMEATKRMLHYMGEPNPEELMAQPPDPMQDIENQMELQRVRNDTLRAQTGAFKAETEVIEMRAKAIKALADAEAAEKGKQIEAYKAALEAIARRDEARRVSGASGTPAGGGGSGPSGSAV